MKRAGGFLAMLAAFVVFSAAALRIQHDILEQMRSDPQSFRDSLYLPSSEHVKLITLGYDHFSADFLWMRAIQTFGATYVTPEFLPQMTSYFDVITDLDPHFISAYSFGNMVLGEEAGRHDLGLRILDKGIENNPEFYRLAFEAAFFSYWQMNDPDLAKGYIRKAIRAPDVPPYVAAWEGYFELKMGRYLAAYDNYLGEYMRFYNAGNDQFAQIKLAMLRRAIDEWYTVELRAVATAFWEEHGRNPSLQELEAAGLLRGIEWPDWVALRDYLEQVEFDGQALPTEPEEIQALGRVFVRTNWDQMPPNPASENIHFPGYLIWPGIAPLSPADPEQAQPEATEMVENALFCMSQLQAATQLVREFARLEGLFLQPYQDEHNGECYGSLEELPEQRLNHEVPEPWGGRFYLDPVDCKIKSTSHEGKLAEKVASALKI